jgi:two-component system, LytTR family, sensor kinase
LIDLLPYKFSWHFYVFNNKMNTSTALKIFTHVVVWLLFFALILSVSTSMGSATFLQQLLSINFYIFCFIYLFIFYCNSLILFPNLYLKKKFILYFTIILALGTIVFSLTPFDNLLSHFAPPPGMRPPPAHNPPYMVHVRRGPFIDINSLILFLLVWLASVATQTLKLWRSSQQRAIIAESDKKTAELAFLKAHINPHFLFNTLNNIYSLAVTNHEQTAVNILKLSNIMRYVTESVAIDFIALENEVECIVDYVDLQKLRLNNKVYLDFSITGNTQNKMIAPLLLMTFIENIFKYGVSNHYQSTITIKLFIGKNTITFYCQNRIFNQGYKYDREGFGISNTKRRLEFLYPGQHSLDIQTDKGLYTVQLTLHTE